MFDMKEKRLSVVVPVYNVEKYLNECVDSILCQSYDNFELILVDDGSIDSSGKICDEYAVKDKRVKVIHKKNEGVSAARNDGIDLATGDYLTFIDSDDNVDTDFFGISMQDMIAQDAQLYVSGLEMYYRENGVISKTFRYGIDENKHYSVKTFFEDAVDKFPIICICGPCCKLYDLSVIKNNKIYFEVSLNFGEDTVFNLKYLDYIDKIYFSKDIYYHYRRENTNSLFTRFRRNSFEVNEYVYDIWINLMKKQDCSKISVDGMERQVCRMYLNAIHEHYQHKDQTTKKERIDLMKKIGRNAKMQKYKLFRDRSFRCDVVILCIKLKMFFILDIYFNKLYKNLE